MTAHGTVLNTLGSIKSLGREESHAKLLHFHSLKTRSNVFGIEFRAIPLRSVELKLAHRCVEWLESAFWIARVSGLQQRLRYCVKTRMGA